MNELEQLSILDLEKQQIKLDTEKVVYWIIWYWLAKVGFSDF